jgi:hypothetical protein
MEHQKGLAIALAVWALVLAFVQKATNGNIHILGNTVQILYGWES